MSEFLGRIFWNECLGDGLEGPEGKGSPCSWGQGSGRAGAARWASGRGREGRAGQCRAGMRRGIPGGPSAKAGPGGRGGAAGRWRGPRRRWEETGAPPGEPDGCREEAGAAGSPQSQPLSFTMCDISMMYFPSLYFWLVSKACSWRGEAGNVGRRVRLPPPA